MATNHDRYQDQGHPFHVGGLYANRNGEYEVVDIAPPKMTVRYHDGGTLVADIAILARIWENLQAPPEAPEPRARATRSTTARTSAAKTAAASKTPAAPKAVATPKAPATPRAPRQPRTPKE
jgi:hypothetical protein